MGLIPENKIAEIRDRTDIVAIIGEHLPLRRAGVNHLGLCPFHAEKTPSFNVNAQKQFFYCFGCQKSGDVFRFLMELEGRTFVEVARDLARRAGIEIVEADARESAEQKRRRQQNEDERAKLLRLHDIAAAYFEGHLQGSPPARDYLQERGIGDEVRVRFRLGYAPESWDGLVRLFEQKRVPHELVEKSGLCIRRKADQGAAGALPAGAPPTKSSHYDRFRDRIIFPLININGDVIAFGGRVLPPHGKEADQAASKEAGQAAAGTPGKDAKDAGKEAAKYINSPESPLYKKGDNLYGLHAAKDPARKRKQIVLVEGNFDVLALHQHGVDNAVAPMGTALTDTQVRMLKRLLGSDGHVVLMLDGDRAGRSATLKDIWLFSQANINDMSLFTGSDLDLRVAQLPDGEDPDTYAARDPAGLTRRLKNAKPAVDYVLDEAIKLAEHDNVAGKAKVLMQVAPLLKAVRNPTTLAMYVDRLADSLAIDAKLVWRHIRETNDRAPAAAGPAQGHPHAPYAPHDPQLPAGRQANSAQAAQSARAAALSPAVTALFSLIGDHPRLLPLLPAEVLGRLEDQGLADLLREGQDLLASGEEVSGARLIELSPPELRDAVASAVLAGTFSTLARPEHALAEIGLKIRSRFAQRELDDLNRALARAYQAGDQERIQELLLRMHELRLLKAGQVGPQA